MMHEHFHLPIHHHRHPFAFSAGHHGSHFGRGARPDRASGRGGGHRGRVFAQGDLQLVILALLAQQPRHGYELIKAIEEKFGGQYTPSPGAIYPTLTLLEEQSYARSSVDTEGGPRRLYTLTDEGAAYVAAHQAELDGVMARMDLAARAMAGEAAPDAVMQAMHTLKHALVFHRGGWTPEETRRVCDLLEGAANAIVSGGPAA